MKPDTERCLQIADTLVRIAEIFIEDVTLHSGRTAGELHDIDLLELLDSLIREYKYIRIIN